MMDPVVHFEMPYDNRARMAKFYESVFGWKIPGVWQYVSFIDTEGNRVSMLQPCRAIGMRRSQKKEIRFNR